MVVFLVLESPIDSSTPYDVVPASTLVSGSPSPGSSVAYECEHGRLERIVRFVGSQSSCRKWADQKWKDKLQVAGDALEDRPQRPSRASTPFDPTPMPTRKRPAPARASSVAPSSTPAVPVAPTFTAPVLPGALRRSHPGNAVLTAAPSDLDHWRREIEEAVKETRRLAEGTENKVDEILKTQKILEKEVGEVVAAVREISANMPKARGRGGYRGVSWLTDEEVDELYGGEKTMQGFVRAILDAIASPTERDLDLEYWDPNKIAFCKECLKKLGGQAAYEKWGHYASRYKDTRNKRLERSGFFPV